MSWLWLPLIALLSAPPSETVPALTLAWDAPASCPNEAHVRGRVAFYLSDATPLRELSARAQLRETDGGWALELSYDGGDKIIQAPSCDELADAAALVLSLALTPEEEAAPSGPDSPDSPDSPEPKESPPELPIDDDTQADVAAPARDPSARAGPGARALIRADAGVGVGITPTLTTATLTAGVLWPRARLEVSGTLWTPSDVRGVSEPELVTMGTVALRGCGVLERRARALSVPVCAGVALGSLRVDERDAGPVQISHQLWSGAVVGPALVWHFRPYAALWFGPELWLSFGRVVPPGAQTQFRGGLVAVRGVLGIEFSFPSRTPRRPGNKTR